MENKKNVLKTQAQEAVQKASMAVMAATEALNEVNRALESIRKLEMDELDQVVGGAASDPDGRDGNGNVTLKDGDSAWGDIPNPIENPYPVNP